MFTSAWYHTPVSLELFKHPELLTSTMVPVYLYFFPLICSQEWENQPQSCDWQEKCFYFSCLLEDLTVAVEHRHPLLCGISDSWVEHLPGHKLKIPFTLWFSCLCWPLTVKISQYWWLKEVVQKLFQSRLLGWTCNDFSPFKKFVDCQNISLKQKFSVNSRCKLCKY